MTKNRGKKSKKTKKEAKGGILRFLQAHELAKNTRYGHLRLEHSGTNEKYTDFLAKIAQFWTIFPKLAKHNFSKYEFRPPKQVPDRK